MLVGKFLYQDSTPIRAERGNTVEKEAGAGRKAVGGGGPHLKLQIAILPWPWFRFCKVMLWRKVSGIYQESWYNFATTIDAMKRLAPPHLPPLFSARSLTPFSGDLANAKVFFVVDLASHQLKTSLCFLIDTDL